jgi:MFS superfamily sulfate permease-like transporter
VIAALAEAFRRAMEPSRTILSPAAGERSYEPYRPAAVAVSEGIAIYRFGAPLFFGNADVFLDDMRELARSADASLHTLVVNADALCAPDATARDALQRSQDLLSRRGIRLVFGNARAPLREALGRAGSFTVIDEREFIADLKKARKIS